MASLIWLLPLSAYSQAMPAQDQGNKTILVAGATGRQGGAVARELLRQGYRVRGLTRNPHSDRAQALAKLGAELVQGDFEDSASILRALEGVYGVFSIQNYWEHGAEAEIRQGTRFADAALKSGVSHFIVTSVAHADEATGIPHFDSKYEIEKHIRSSGLPYTIFRPVAFMENWEYSRKAILAGELSGPFAPDTVLQQISVRDIGRFVADAFEKPREWLGKSLNIAGDEYTVSQAVEIFARVTGRDITYRQIAWDKHLAKAGEDMAHMDHWIDEVGYHVNLKEVRTLLPNLMTLEEYLRWTGWADNKQ